MKILIDNGHGADTPGKRSPDGRLEEWKFAREISTQIVAELQVRGFDAERIVTEVSDIPLRTRCQRVNAICREAGTKNVLLVSIHANAAGSDGKWHTARGFSAHVGLNASSKSKIMAQYLWNAAIEQGLKGNRSVPEPKYIRQNLAMCRDTLCPAVLTENLFYDNREDCEFMLSEEGKRKIVAAHVTGLTEFLNDFKL